METFSVNWIRPPGPPIMWRIIDAKEKLNDNTFVSVRLSIQDIPPDRYEEALDHMCQYFQADEPLNKYWKIKEDENGTDSNRLIWSYYLKQGMCIGAFKLNSSGELGELIGMNILYVSSDKNRKRIDKILKNSKSSNIKKLFALVHEVSDKVDIRQMYGVDRYLSEMGLSVKPSFRGQKLGLRLLEIWTDIGRKYGISVASALFSAPASQIQGERAGFKTLNTVKYAEVLDENEKPLFPNIEADTLKLMVKQL